MASASSLGSGCFRMLLVLIGGILDLPGDGFNDVLFFNWNLFVVSNIPVLSLRCFFVAWLENWENYLSFKKLPSWPSEIIAASCSAF